MPIDVWLTFLTPLIAFMVAALAVGWLARGPASTFALDQPNARSLHETPVPRTGGIGLLLGIAAGWAVAGFRLPGLLLIGFVLLVGVSLADDLRERGLPVGFRLLVQLAAASLALLALEQPSASWACFAMTVLAIGWMSNLYNFMDGADGLAGGMALFGFLAYAVAGFLSGNTPFAMLNLAVAAASAGFLLHNFHPARIFLGDTGSVPLGFLAAVFGVVGWQNQDWTWWFPILVFSPFILDASLTLAKRMCVRAAIWRAHRDHYYQRLVRMGWGHRRTAIAAYVLMFLCAIVALAALDWPEPRQLALLCVMT